MGVHGLWDLLAPVGRRVSVETLSGKKLAIDASIWMIQFMKAMRDEKGEMVRNAHLLGFFRRICKLLYLRTKPVFVFDGATPALKRRTVIARRRQRENAQAKIRKTAEKLLLNHLKSMRLKELAKELENQRKEQKKADGDDAKGKKVFSDEGKIDNNQEMLDEMLAASIANEEDWRFDYKASTSAAVEEDDDDDEYEDIILPEMDGNVDPAVLASLPPSMQLDLLMRQRLTVDNNEHKWKVNKDTGQDEDHKSNAKDKEVLIDLTEMERSNLERDNVVAECCNQEKLDEMLAASIAAEEDERLTRTASTSAAAIPSEEEGNDEDEEMILPAMSGKVDPDVLAALPPSMQLDLLVQMRERLMAENRQKYQKVKKAPEKFSELQIEAYLKTVAFRREIDQVQKAAAGNGVGGVQSSRIASEANREFIFSSSFTGDKQLLTSSGVQGNGNKQKQTPTENPSDSANNVASTSKSSAVTGLFQDDSRGVFHEDVETYLDERGRIRVSRVRAMGMRMTRDLQRNLDLMKEIEQEGTPVFKTASAQSELIRDQIGSSNSIPSKRLNVTTSHDKNGGTISLNERNRQPILNNEGSMQISFEVDGGSHCFDSDDDVFTSLVATQPVKTPAENVTSRMKTSEFVPDGDWEEAIIGKRGNSSASDLALETNLPDKVSSISDDSEVEWEDGGGDQENSSFPSESRKPASRGYMEEEADLQEAIRRSLEDLGGEEFKSTLSEHEKLKPSEEDAYKDVGFLDREDNTTGLIQPERNVTKQDKSYPETLATRKMDRVGQSDSSQVFPSLQSHLNSEARVAGSYGILKNNSFERHSGPKDLQTSQETNITGSARREMPSAESGAALEANKSHVTVEQSSDAPNEAVELSTSIKIPSGVSCSSKAVCDKMPSDISIDNKGSNVEVEPSLLVNEEKAKSFCHSVEISIPSPSVMDPSIESIIGTDVKPNLDGEKNFDDLFNEQDMDNFVSSENMEADFSEATLQEEIMILGQESRNLGSEQKKLERNAESVSSEMFAECQELLQMFGLPYIIAPMEAEAQCAYMELANLVDGVVTDDSDVFLFGARSVYKNIFDDRKYVETYFMKDIEKELGLNREKLIRMALLLGSDYTEGISGIGIVNAIEVVNAFPEEDGLEKFREWIESPDPAILGKLDAHAGLRMRKKCDSNSANNKIGDGSSGQSIPEAYEEDHTADHIQEIRQIFMEKHRNVSKNWHVPSSFPSEAVISAYLCPQVDKSTEPFTWGKPDLHVLRRLCWEKFAWGIQKSDELLLPVLKEYNKHETQLRLEAFYTFNERFAKIRSKRIKKALKGITGHQPSKLMDDDVKECSRNRKKRTIRHSDSGDSKPDAHSKRAKRGVSRSKADSLEKSISKKSKKRTVGEPSSTEVQIPGQKQQADSRRSTHKGQHGDKRGREHQRRRGREREIESERSDSSYDYVSGGDEELDVRVEKSEGPQEVRRSMRSRKPANYTLDDLEIDIDGTTDQGVKWSNEEVVEPGLFGDVGENREANGSLSGKGQREVDDPLPGDFCKDYLDTGGEELFTDDDGSSKAGVSQNCCLNEASISKNYLKMGGGFCVDESETCTDQDNAHCPSITAFMETSDSSNLFGNVEEAGGGGLVPPNSSVKITLNDMQDGGKTDAYDTEKSVECANARDSGDLSTASLSQAESAGSKKMVPRLSPMPFLKRKRRKN